MRIIVTGSRNWTDEDAIHGALNEYALHAAKRGEPLTIIHGDCPTGADRIAREWCETNTFVTEERYPADWEKHGKAAGPIRNTLMVTLGADLVLAFPLGESRGTHHCMKTARTHGIGIVEYS